jgi:hypothetical protein
MSEEQAISVQDAVEMFDLIVARGGYNLSFEASLASVPTGVTHAH